MARALTLTLQNSLPPASVLYVDVFENDFLGKKPEAVPRLDLKFYAQELKVDTSNKGPSSLSSLASDKPNLKRSFSCRQEANCRNSQACKEKH